MRASVFFTLGFAVLAGCSDATDKPDAKQPLGAPAVPAAVKRVAETAQVIAYYFHGTVRCETCLKIERQAREAIEQRFPLEMAENRLVFKPVNYDKPENAHFLKEYKLTCPSLVVVRQKSAKDEKWTLLDKTWEHVENPVQFNEYVEGETERLLNDVK
jgi:hypothetical protein